MERPIVKIPLEDGAMTKVPLLTQNGNNWVATITPNQNSAGGMDRKFWTQANTPGMFYILPEGLKINTAIEMAADEFTNGKGYSSRSRNRMYYIVIGITKSEITLIQYKTGLSCIRASIERNLSAPTMKLGDISQIVIYAAVCEGGWALSSGEIVERPHRTVNIGGHLWMLDYVEPDRWYYVLAKEIK
jgi:hypothetical protein